MRLCRAASSRSILALAAATATLAAVAAPALAQGFAPGFHTYEPSNSNWGVTAISDDGTTVTGFNFVNGVPYGFTIQSSGVQHFPEVSRSYDASDNGAYTVGYSTRRAADGTTQTLVPGTQPEASFGGTSISGDGQTVTGISEFVLGNMVIGASTWRWNATSGVTQLGPYRPNSAITQALNISRDGSTIVGTGSDALFGNRTEAWMWREGEGFMILPDAPGAPYVYSQAVAVNFDGTFIVGAGSSAQGRQHALVWRDGMPTAMPAPAGYRDSNASDVSDDGSIIAGTIAGSLVGLPQTGAVWTDTTGWIPAMDYLRGQGVDVPAYFASTGHFQMSADGRTFAGITTDSRTGNVVAFVASVPAPGATAIILMFGMISRRARARR